MRRRPLAHLRPPQRLDQYDPNQWESIGAYEDAVTEYQETHPLLMTPLDAFQRRLAARKTRRKQ